jgi:ATP-dependent Clp protease ATP-binding subunit ClpB
VKRAIQRDLENPIAKLIVAGKYLPGATIKVTAKDGAIVL